MIYAILKSHKHTVFAQVDNEVADESSIKVCYKKVPCKQRKSLTSNKTKFPAVRVILLHFRCFVRYNIKTLGNSHKSPSRYKGLHL